jgi:hypothetical protein
VVPTSFHTVNSPFNVSLRSNFEMKLREIKNGGHSINIRFGMTGIEHKIREKKSRNIKWGLL